MNGSASCTALIVEDEWLVRLDMAEALEAAGFGVIEAEDGEAAIEHFAEIGHVHILVTDIRLAGVLTGWDIAEAYRRTHPAGGVIYASANVPLADRQVKDSHFFHKPVTAGDLVAKCMALCLPRDAKP